MVEFILLPTGNSEAWYRARFGTVRPRVQIPVPRYFVRLFSVLSPRISSGVARLILCFCAAKKREITYEEIRFFEASA